MSGQTVLSKIGSKAMSQDQRSNYKVRVQNVSSGSRITSFAQISITVAHIFSQNTETKIL